MPLEPELGTPVEWLRRAKSNLIRAKQPRLEGVFWEDLCFDAQQSVEKALKGLLTFYGIPFRCIPVKKVRKYASSLCACVRK